MVDDKGRQGEVTEIDASKSYGSGIHGSGSRRWHYVEHSKEG